MMKGFTVSVTLLLAVAFSTALPQKYLTQPFLEEDSDEHGQFRGPKSTNCSCGVTNKAKRRIVGGVETLVNEYPHMVGLAKQVGGGFGMFCGATILTPYHCITAAHCTYQNTAQLAVVAGEHDITDAYETRHTKIYLVRQIVEHELYDPKTFRNDIAILIVANKIAYNEAVGPACLPTRPMNTFLVGQNLKVTGWGTTSFRGSASRKLLKVNLKCISLAECATQYRNIDAFNPTQICTYRNQKDSCQGDSGGPVTWLDPETNRYTLVGLVSYGAECATSKPGVNTDVWYFLNWVQNVITRTSPERVNTCAKIG